MRTILNLIATTQKKGEFAGDNTSFSRLFKHFQYPDSKSTTLWFNYNFSTLLTFYGFINSESFEYGNKVYMTALALDFNKL